MMLFLLCALVGLLNQFFYSKYLTFITILLNLSENKVSLSMQGRP